jgi:hypothetical protein
MKTLEAAAKNLRFARELAYHWHRSTPTAIFWYSTNYTHIHSAMNNSIDLIAVTSNGEIYVYFKELDSLRVAKCLI